MMAQEVLRRLQDDLSTPHTGEGRPALSQREDETSSSTSNGLAPELREALIADGLDKYVQVFAKEEIDLESFLLLKDEDLRNMSIPTGMSPFLLLLLFFLLLFFLLSTRGHPPLLRSFVPGPRKKILQRIQSMSIDPSSYSSPSPSLSSPRYGYLSRSDPTLSLDVGRSNTHDQKASEESHATAGQSSGGTSAEDQSADWSASRRQRAFAIGGGDVPASAGVTRLREPPRARIDSRILRARWEIDFDELVFEERIGSGNFGIVWRAKWRNSLCVVKKLRGSNIEEAQLREFREESRVWMCVALSIHLPTTNPSSCSALCSLLCSHYLPRRNLRPHGNVVQFLGACSKAPNICIVTEYLPLGDAHRLVRSQPISLKSKLHLLLGIAAGCRLFFLLHRVPFVRRLR